MRFIRRSDNSNASPLSPGVAPPTIDVFPPCGTMGIPAFAQSVTMNATSFVLSGETSAHALPRYRPRQSVSHGESTSGSCEKPAGPSRAANLASNASEEDKCIPHRLAPPLGAFNSYDVQCFALRSSKLMTSFRPFLTATALLLTALPATLDAQTTTVRRLTIRERVIRIPLNSPAAPLPRPEAAYKESRGPKCVQRANIAGASLNGLRSIDFILRDRSRLRARLESSCPAIDYYAGFYLNPTPDGNICSDRDAVHARSGGECQIDAFRKLSPKRPRAKR